MCFLSTAALTLNTGKLLVYCIAARLLWNNNFLKNPLIVQNHFEGTTSGSVIVVRLVDDICVFLSF